MKHIPNLLSCFRILLIPFFVWQLLAGHTLAAGIILLVSGLTDFFDGLLARRFGWITSLGKVLDPVADKLTQAAVSVALAIRLRQYWYFFVIMILKDLVMMALGAGLLKKGCKLEGSRWFGKVSTFVYYTVMILLVLFPRLPQGLVVGLLILATACALVSALLYIPEYRRYRQQQTVETA